MALTKQEKEELFNDLLHFLSQSSVSVEDLKEVQNLGEINSFPAYKKDTKELVTIPTSTLTKASEDANNAAQQANMAGAAANRAAQQATSAAQSVQHAIENLPSQVETTVTERLGIYEISPIMINFTNSSNRQVYQEGDVQYQQLDDLLNNYAKFILGSLYLSPYVPNKKTVFYDEYRLNRRESGDEGFIGWAPIVSTPFLSAKKDCISFSIADIIIERVDASSDDGVDGIAVQLEVLKTIQIRLSGGKTTYLEEINSTEITDLKP